ncbi:MAG: GNAT family N-acetyltransferase [Peptostreptococcus sp.]|uniref:GNAT family N-acetyltransferase n=1 Tax=Peptostreptococcus sp. TaxID=1262 RepID=UPI002FC807FF
MKIESERCLIREFRKEDMDSFMDYRNDLEWMKYQGFKGLKKEEYIKSIIGQNNLEEGFQLAIIEKDKNKLIGDLYLKKEENIIWIGYSIAKSMSRQHYAYEVLLATVEFLKDIDVKYIKAVIDVDNAASIALIKKLNFLYETEENGEKIFFLEL